MRQKISLFVLCGVLLWGAFANYTEISHPEQRLTTYYRTHAYGGYDVPDHETDVAATLMKLTGINTAVLLLSVVALLVGGFRFQSVNAVAAAVQSDPSHTIAPTQRIENPPRLLPKRRPNPKIKIGRLAFLGWMIAWALLTVGWAHLFFYLATVDGQSSDVSFAQDASWLVVVLPSCIACLFILAFRFRSMGYSGWMALWTLLPVISFFMILACLLMPPSEKPEPFNPKVMLYILFAVVAMLVAMLISWAMGYQ